MSYRKLKFEERETGFDRILLLGFLWRDDDVVRVKNEGLTDE